MIDETNGLQIDETENNNSSPSGKKKYCEKCHKQYDASSTQCPYCGHKNKHTALKVAIGVMVGGTIIFGVIPDLAKDKGDDSSSVPDRAIVTEADTTAEATTEAEITTSEGTITGSESKGTGETTLQTESAQTEPETEEDFKIDLGSQNALRSAIDYIEFMDFSYLSLISQLEYEGYSHEEAVYGADNCGADWNDEALECAKSYIDIGGYSYKSLYDQLVYEKFTDEQAKYGVDNCNADWKEQAVQSAKSYLDTSNFSRQELLEQLLYENFSQEEAEYALSQVGY